MNNNLKVVSGVLVLATTFSIIFLSFGSGTEWDISTAVYLQLKSVGSEDTYPMDVFFKPDGTKMYVVGRTNDNVYEYDLSIAWNVTTATYTQKKDIKPQENYGSGVFFKPDGTKMYVVGYDFDYVHEYDLSIAWNVTTAIFIQNKSIGTQDTRPEGIFFKPDGTKMYTSGITNDNVYEYDLSIAWNVTTATYVQSKSISDNYPTDVFFKPDGTKMYVVASGNTDVYEYDLSIAWNVTTATYVQSFDTSNEDLYTEGVFFNATGNRMYVVGTENDNVNEYDLPVAPVDTCTCPGAGNNWEIDMSDYCNITEACDLTTGYLNFTGAGATRCNATITTTNLGDPGASGILYIQNNCLINVKG